MENLYYNLSEEEFSKGRKALLWGFSSLFFIAGVYVLIISLVFNKTSISPILSLAPFGISLIVGIISSMATIKRKNLFFSIDENKIEFRYGLFKPEIHNFPWTEIKEVTMPVKQRKAQLLFNDGSSYIINLTWLQRKKSSNIKKHIYYSAKAKNLIVKKVPHLLAYTH
jgi:hypothetical protein